MAKSKKQKVKKTTLEEKLENINQVQQELQVQLTKVQGAKELLIGLIEEGKKDGKAK